MSRILDMEGWDAYGAAGSLLAGAPYNVLYPNTWSTVAVTNPPWLPGSGTGYALKATATSAPSTGTNPGAGVYTPRKWAGLQAMICGFWFIIDTLPSTSVAFFRMNDSRANSGSQVPPYGVDQSYLSLSSAGVIGSQNASNSSHGTVSISTATWHFLEIFYFIGDASGGTNKQGSMQLNIDGSAAITNSNCNTRFTGINSFVIDDVTFDCEFDQTCVLRFGPWYWLDPQGAGASAMLGKQRFQMVFPVSTSGVTHFTSSDSNTIGDITTKPPGAGYIYDATQGDADVYTPGSIGISTIKATQVQLSVAQNGRGGRMAAPVIQSWAGGVPVDTAAIQGMGTPGGAAGDSTSFAFRRAMTITNPYTGLPWTGSEIAAAKIGEKVFQ